MMRILLSVCLLAALVFALGCVGQVSDGKGSLGRAMMTQRIGLGDGKTSATVVMEAPNGLFVESSYRTKITMWSTTGTSTTLETSKTSDASHAATFWGKAWGLMMDAVKVLAGYAYGVGG